VPDVAELHRFIDKKVGLASTLIVLSADHGMVELPEYMSEPGSNSVEPHVPGSIINMNRRRIHE